MITSPNITYISILDREPDESCYHAHFQAMAKLLADAMGVERYRQWFDKRFPGDGDEHTYTWREKWEMAEAAYSRIMDSTQEHRDERIERELIITLDDGEAT